MWSVNPVLSHYGVSRGGWIVLFILWNFPTALKQKHQMLLYHCTVCKWRPLCTSWLFSLSTDYKHDHINTVIFWDHVTSEGSCTRLWPSYYGIRAEKTLMCSHKSIAGLQWETHHPCDFSIKSYEMKGRLCERILCFCAELKALREDKVWHFRKICLFAFLNRKRNKEINITLAITLSCQHSAGLS